MADIQFTFDEPADSILQFTGRVGQTVQITLDITSATSYRLNLPLPAGLTLDSGVISGTLMQSETLSYPTDGDVFINVIGASGNIFGYMVVLPATTSASLTTNDVTTIIEAALGTGDEASTSSASTPTPDPNGYLTGTNAAGDISIPVDFDLETDQVFIPNAPALPTAGEESTAALPDWAPGTFSVGSIISVKEDDRFPLAIGFLRPSELIEVGNLTSIEVFARERAGETRYDISEAGQTKMSNLNRYKVILNLQGQPLKDILNSYESPDGAYVDLMAEIRLTVTIPAAGSAPESILQRTSHTFALRFEQKMGD